MPLLAISSTVPAAGGLGPAITTGITKVGTTKHSPFAGGTTVTTLTFTSLNPGDLIVAVANGGGGGVGAFPTSMGSPQSTGWQNAAGPFYGGNTPSGFGGSANIWFGTVVNPTTNDALAVTWGGSFTSTLLDIYQFSTGVDDNVWTVDQSGGTPAGAASGTIAFGSLTPTGTNELYFGASTSGNSPTNGSTAGFVYDQDNVPNVNCYNVAVSAAVAPTATQSSALFSAARALFRPFAAAAKLNSNEVILGVVPTGRMWVVSQIGYEILPAVADDPANPIIATVTLNGRAVYTGQNGNGGSNQGPPYFSIRVGDELKISWTNVPIGSSCVGNFFYNEYSANAQPSDIGGVV
jgi:hypothetical protein